MAILSPFRLHISSASHSVAHDESPPFITPCFAYMQAIQGYRETEKPIWNEVNTPTITRLREFAFGKDLTVMQHVHVLDLAENGHIKPHLDSVKVTY